MSEMNTVSGMTPNDFEGWKEFALGAREPEVVTAPEAADVQEQPAAGLSDLGVAHDDFIEANHQLVLVEHEYAHAGWLRRLTLKRELADRKAAALAHKQRVDYLASLVVPRPRASAE